jgi:two-component system response regulator VicR
MRPKTQRILVVDDEYDMVDLVRLILEAEGYQVVTATSGREALQKLSAEPCDLLLLDVNMPDMDGWQLIQKVREQEDGAHLPIIMVTAKSHSMDRIMGLTILHVNDYITKPFGRQELVRCVEKHLEAVPVA